MYLGSPNTAMAEFVFTMHNVRKTLGEKLILDNVTMSFFPDAKIGVVGPNGAGKSTLLKIMAGLENANNGDVMLAKDATVGILMQEPPLTEDKTVLENVQEAVAETKALIDRYNQISIELGEPDADYDALLEEMGDLSTELDHREAWELDSKLEQAMDALRCPDPDMPVNILSGGERRRVALCCSSSPTCCSSTSRPTISTPRASPGWRLTSSRTRALSSR